MRFVAPLPAQFKRNTPLVVPISRGAGGINWVGTANTGTAVGSGTLRMFDNAGTERVVVRLVPDAKAQQHVFVALLARLAVDRSMQGRGLGVALLMDTFSRCLTLSEQLAIHAVAVDAIDEAAAAFYAKFRFVPLVDDPRYLYLPMATVEQAFGRRGG